MADRPATTSHNIDPGSWGIAAIFVAAMLLAKLPVLGLPYHWDEAGAYVVPAHWLAEVGLHHILPGLHPPGQFFGHPPATYLGLATLYTMFGHSIWLTHTFAVLLASGSLYLTFRLGALILDVKTGLLAALLLFSSPLFFAQSGLMHGDMMVTFFGLLTVYLFFTGRMWGYMVSAVVLLLAKETGVAFIAAILVYRLVLSDESGSVRGQPLVLAAPLLVTVLFFGAQLATYGQLVTNPYFERLPLFRLSLHGVVSVTEVVFMRQGRWILSLGIVIAALVFGRRFWRKEFGLFALVILCFLGAFSVLFSMDRYSLPVFPYLSIMAAWALVLLSEKQRLVPVVALAGLAAFFVLKLDGAGRRRGSYERTMEYVDIVRMHQEAARFLETHHSDEKILAAWPLVMALGQPFLGYVDRPLDTSGSRADYDLLVWTAQGAEQNRALLDFARAEGLKPLRRFARNNKDVVVYWRGGASGANRPVP
jgi:4-amino-4-deoxy-L-arabinose transferase-like glycosyltransferase